MSSERGWPSDGPNERHDALLKMRFADAEPASIDLLRIERVQTSTQVSERLALLFDLVHQTDLVQREIAIAFDHRVLIVQFQVTPISRVIR